MYNLFFIFFLFAAANIAKISMYKITKKTNGFDHRPTSHIDKYESLTQLYRVYTHFKKRRILTVLENPDISINTKVKVLEDKSITPLNLFAGNLMKDFYFDFAVEPKDT